VSDTPPPGASSGLLVAADHVVTPAGSHGPGWIEVRGDLLTAVGHGPPPRPPDVDAEDGWLLPGFIDLHVHGGGGADFMDAQSEDVARVVAFHRAHGTTTMLASLVSAGVDELRTAVAALADLADAGLIAGVHLEGPWLARGRCGAHDPRALTVPKPGDVDRLLEAGRGHVRVVTLAPEVSGGLEAVSRVVGLGAVAAVGHTEADYGLTRRAVDAGARLATHLFNAMSGLHHRAPGPVAALLESPEVGVELVLDGVHVHPAMVALAACAAGPDRLLLVTDAIAAAGAPDGEYRLGAQAVQVRDAVARLAGSDVIAGSTLTMDAAWRFAVQVCGLSPADASRAASTNPARALGLAHRTGALSAGLRADVVVLDRSLRVDRVMAAGRWSS
jgi:N-acetylglucosamine-6-phosphate deacetylase